MDVTEFPTGSYPWFPPYRDNVELTGTFGYAAAPGNLRSLARKLASRMYDARGTDMPSPNPVVFLSDKDREVLDRYAGESFAMVA